jgi:hypothetical protein
VPEAFADEARAAAAEVTPLAGAKTPLATANGHGGRPGSLTGAGQ